MPVLFEFKVYNKKILKNASLLPGDLDFPKTFFFFGTLVFTVKFM